MELGRQRTDPASHRRRRRPVGLARATPLWPATAPEATHAATSPSSGTAVEDEARVDATVSVVICAYTEQRWDDLCRAITSLHGQGVPPLEVIVAVDHNSALLRRVRAVFPNVVAVANVARQGLSGARNSGAAVARGDVVAFLDDDAVAEPDWLERLLRGYRDPRVIAVGGAVEPEWVGGRPRSFPDEFAWVVGCTYKGMPERTSPVRNLIGANMSYRREALRALGGFHASLGRVGTKPVGCEETELCVRAARRWPESILLYEPAAKVRHRVPEARARWAYFRARCFAEGLSKAEVVRLAGSARGLSSERAYTLRTLPRGVAHEVGAALWRRDAAGLLRAAGITIGLLYTTTGFVAGRKRRSARAASASARIDAPQAKERNTE